jgi:hypothetical protein
MSQKKEILGRYPSSSNSDKLYTVKRITEAGGRVWIGCDCPGFTRARRWKGVASWDRECKHTALHQLDDPAIGEDSPPPIPVVTFGMVGQVTRRLDAEEGEMILLPLIPLDGMGTDMMATAIYDAMTRFQIPWNVLKERYKPPRQWSWWKVKGYVETHGRTIYELPKNPLGKGRYYQEEAQL